MGDKEDTASLLLRGWPCAVNRKLTWAVGAILVHMAPCGCHRVPTQSESLRQNLMLRMCLGCWCHTLLLLHSLSYWPPVTQSCRQLKAFFLSQGYRGGEVSLVPTLLGSLCWRLSCPWAPKAGCGPSCATHGGKRGDFHQLVLVIPLCTPPTAPQVQDPVGPLCVPLLGASCGCSPWTGWLV